MLAYRLFRKKYNPLSGYGASIQGGRWNSKGTELIYTSTNRSLAMAEVFVHFSMASLPNDYFMAVLFIPDMLSITTLNRTQLPIDWNSHPPISKSKQIGDNFVRDSSFLGLLVPSAVTKGDLNLLINPNHPQFHSIQVIEKEPFPFDNRLVFQED